MAPLVLTPEASAALRRAGSRELPPGPRDVLLWRLRRHGVDVERQNIGGVRCGRWGGGGELATFPDLDAAAVRLVELCRMMAGEHPFAAVQGYEGDGLGEAGARGTFVTLAPEHGAKPLEITHWSKLMPGDRSGDPGTPGYEMGDAGPRVPRPAAHHVILARHHVRERSGRAPALAAGPSTAPATAADLPYDLAGLEGLFGPSDAASSAFQDLCAAWKALEAAPAAQKLPGWKVNHDAWIEFTRAWRAGDDKSPQCNGDCEAGLRGQLLTLNAMRDDVTKILPTWASKLARDLSLEDAKGGLWAAGEKVREVVNEKAPALGWFAAFVSGGAPRWQYGIAIGGGVLAAGAVIRSYLPRGGRTE